MKMDKRPHLAFDANKYIKANENQTGSVFFCQILEEINTASPLFKSMFGLRLNCKLKENSKVNI